MNPIRASTTSTTPELSVLIPCHNGALKIENAVLDWVAAMEHVSPFEIIVVNDGSNDGSARILDSLRREHPQLRVIHQLHTGQAQAIRRGYELARGAYVLELPLEGQFEPQHFWPLWERRLSYQLLVAYSENPTQVSWPSRWTSSLLDRWIHFLFGAHFRAGLSNYRLARTAIVAPLMKRLPVPYESVGMGVSLLIHKEYPYGVREVPIAAALGTKPLNKLVLAVEALQLWASTRRPWFTRRKRKTSSVTP